MICQWKRSMYRCQAWCKKKVWTCSIVGLWSGITAQQRIMSSHKPSETRFFGLCPSGRGGYCLLLILAWITAASRERLENGTSSVIHSSISIANEYVSECVVADILLFSMSSGAAYLTISPDVTVFDVKFSLISSEIVAIPKSQICGSPSRETRTFLHLTLSCITPREWR